jgi:hypothetical protein
MPSDQLVGDIDARLGSVLDSVIRQLPDSSTNAGQYYRQYVGFIARGERLVYINGFRAHGSRSGSESDADSLQWRTYPVATCDAGTGRFEIVYRVERQRFTRLQFGHSLGGPVRY